MSQQIIVEMGDAAAAGHRVRAHSEIGRIVGAALGEDVAARGGRVLRPAVGSTQRQPSQVARQLTQLAIEVEISDLPLPSLLYCT